MAKLHTTEPLFKEGDPDHDPVAEYWTAIEEIVHWAGEQHLVVQLPLCPADRPAA